MSSNWDNHSKVSVSEGEECSGYVMSSLGLWIKERDGETPAVRERTQLLIPSLWTSNSAESESLRSEHSLTQCGVMHGLLERTIRAERDTRDKKGEEGIVDLISPSPGDELFRTASVIINEKKVLFIIVKNQFYSRIWPCIYRGKRISKWSAQNTADVKKNKK